MRDAGTQQVREALDEVERFHIFMSAMSELISPGETLHADARDNVAMLMDYLVSQQAEAQARLRSVIFGEKVEG